MTHYTSPPALCFIQSRLGRKHDSIMDAVQLRV
jgi:hypothetical protein